MSSSVVEIAERVRKWDAFMRIGTHSSTGSIARRVIFCKIFPQIPNFQNGSQMTPGPLGAIVGLTRPAESSRDDENV